MHIVVKPTPEQDQLTINLALLQAQFRGGDDGEVLDIIAGQPVTVTLKGWEWTGVVHALDFLVEHRDEVGGNEQMERDLTRLAAAITDQAEASVNGDAENNAVIAQKLRDAGYGS